MNKKEKKKEREKRERYKNPKLMYMFETLKSSRVFFFLLFYNAREENRDKKPILFCLSLFYVVVACAFAIWGERDEGRRRREGRIARAKEKETFFLSRSV